MARSTTKKVEDKQAKMKSLKNRQDRLADEYNQLNYEAEIERFKELECLNCQHNLELVNTKVNELMTIGTTSSKKECPNCHMVNRITSKYTEDPTIGTAEIVLDEVGFSFMVKAISKLSIEELHRRLDGELKRINGRTSKQPPQIQLIFKIQDELLKEHQTMKERLDALESKK